ncbi:MAG: non-ribosomal peptide synthetase [Acidobacteriota bacterium]|nr:non-ribosomal peptide synthetase [Acidobacteriota bacterium]
MSVNRCIHDLFEEQAARTPESPALLTGNYTCTYRELNERANRLGNLLIRMGAGPDSMVAMSLERSIEMIVAMLGILKAGGAYVPVDASYPEERRAFMLRDTAAPLVLDARWLDENADAIARESAANPESGAGPDNLAYVMYTSGSTGRPKGVMIEHRSVARLVRETDYAELGAGETILQLAPVSFDASTFEIWGALLNGGKLAIMPPHAPSLEEIGRGIGEFGVTTMWLTAGLFHVMVDRNIDGLKPLKQLLAGGDVLSPVHVRKFLEAVPGCKLINGYGPTEGATFTCCHTVASADAAGQSVPIGKPIAHTQAYILDEKLRPVAPGLPGELYAGGAGIARGYLNQPALTAEKFIPDPFSIDPRARLYKTGDLARERPGGTLEFLGRSDDQIKCNGFRIELGEIEAVLNEHPGVRQAVVVARTSGRSGEKRLVGYIVPSVPADLRGHLASKLPAYMIPLTFVDLASLPLTPNGKVDRGALPEPKATVSPVPPSSAAPVSDTEETIAAVWRKLLGIERVGMEDNFFDLGGDSLLLMAAHADLNRALDTKFPITDLFEFTTVGSLARRVHRKPAGPADFSAARDRANKQREVLARQKRARAVVNR